MKKFIIVLVGICLLTGCDTLNNTPTKQVEMMLADYQTLNQDVLDDLDQVVFFYDGIPHFRIQCL